MLFLFALIRRNWQRVSRYGWPPRRRRRTFSEEDIYPPIGYVYVIVMTAN